jgi:hypothetical protein
MIKNPEPVRDGWSIYYPDRLGEYFILVMLLEELHPSLAIEASSGWLGDNSTLYIGHDTYLLIWESVWKDEESSSLFEKALNDLFKEKGGEKTDLYWVFDERFVAIQRSGEAVMLISSSNEQIITEEVKSKFVSTD